MRLKLRCSPVRTRMGGAVCSAAVVGVRLSQSYQFLNRLNAELETLNGSLE